MALGMERWFALVVAAVLSAGPAAAGPSERGGRRGQSRAGACEEAVAEMDFGLFAPPRALCPEPEALARACARLETRPGFSAFSRQAGQARQAPALARSLCQKDPEQVRGLLCAAAVKEAQAGGGPEVLSFLADSCPDESAQLAAALCGGGGDPQMPENLRELCARFGGENPQAVQALPAVPKERRRAEKPEGGDEPEREGKAGKGGKPGPRKEGDDTPVEQGKQLLDELLGN